jgi:hypothetical protein
MSRSQLDSKFSFSKNGYTIKSTAKPGELRDWENSNTLTYDQLAKYLDFEKKK